MGSVPKEEVKSGALFALATGGDAAGDLDRDGSGSWGQQRLGKGTFAWPKPGDGVAGKLPLRAEALSMLMDGIDLRGAKMRRGTSVTKKGLISFIA